MMELLQGLFKTYLPQLQAFSVLLLKAFLILIVGWYLARILSRKVRRILAKKDEILANFFSQVVFVAVNVLTIITMLGTLGVQTASVLAVIGTAGLAIALSLKDSLSSLASGIILIILRPFNKGDIIETGGIYGKVESINLFNTTVVLPDEKMVVLPNRNIAAANITNTTKNSDVCVDWTFKVDASNDIQKVREAIEAAVDDLDYNREKNVLIVVSDLSSSGIDFRVRFWAKRDKGEFVPKSLTIESIKNHLDKNGIILPQTSIYVSNRGAG